jgi:hypothetical protein
MASVALLALAILCVEPRPATGAIYLGPTPYLGFSDSPFFGGGLSYFHLEDFEDGALNVPGVTASGGFVLGPAPLTDSVDADDGMIDGSGSGAHSSYSAGQQKLVFAFSAAALGTLPTHVGIVWTDVGFVLSDNNTLPATAKGHVVFEAFDALGQSLVPIGPYLVGDGEYAGQTVEDRFFGVIHAGGISRIEISMPTIDNLDSGSNDWEVDHLQFGVAVPEPATFLIWSAIITCYFAWACVSWRARCVRRVRA